MSRRQRQALDQYLAGGVAPHPRGGVTESTLAAALREARALTGRDRITGSEREPSLSWPGAATYLLLILQLGHAVKPCPGTRSAFAQRRIDHPRVGPRRAPHQLKPGSSEWQFRSTLVDYSTIDDDLDVSALWALRCSFAHDFSLVNTHSTRSDLRHRFRLSDLGSIVQRPSRRWSGTFPGRLRAEQSTAVNLHAIGQVVEDVVSNIRAADRRGLVRPRLDPEEFQARFLFRFSE